MNRRGDVTDIPFLAILVVVLIMVAVLGYMILNQVRTDPTVIAVMPAEAQTAMLQAENTILMFDNLLALLFFLGIGAGMMSAFLVRAHPAFFILYFLIMLIMGSLMTIFANVYYEFASNSFISTYANQFPMSNLLMQNLPLITIVGMILIAIVLFGKPGGVGGGDGAY